MASPVDNKEKMRRVAELHVGIGGIHMDTMCFKRMISMQLDNDETFNVEVADCTNPLQDQPIYDPTISEAWKKTFASISQCQTVIAWHLPWLLWITERKYLESPTLFLLTSSAGQGINLKERTFTDPKPRRKWVCRYVDHGRTMKSDEFDHTVLILSSTNGGNEKIVSDPSYAQYSFDQGIDDLSAFKRDKLYGNSHPFLDKLGESVKDAKEYEESRRVQAQHALTTQTINRIVFEEIGRFGGPESFLGLEAKAYEDARNDIFARVKKELEALRPQLEALIYPVVNEAELENLEEQCDSQGNRECFASYRRQAKIF